MKRLLDAALTGQGLPPPRHHPPVETLAGFAGGQLRAGFDFVVAVHLRGCAQCRAEVARLETIGGALLDTLEPMMLDDAVLAATLAKLDRPAPPEPSTPRTIADVLDSARRRWVAPGVWVANVDTPRAREDRVFLLSAAPGMSVAPHRHPGMELTQVMSGALNDAGVIYHAGDLVEIDDARTHRPHAEGAEPCVCLFAVRGRLVPETWIGKLAFMMAGV